MKSIPCRLFRDADLTWKPWVGNSYKEGGLMVVGDTNYADGDMGATPEAAIATVNNDWHFTENVVRRFCISRKDTNRTFDAITYLLMKSASDKVEGASSAVWNSFAYIDAIQRAMRGRGWGFTKRERPCDDLWEDGWKAVCGAVRLLRPGRLLFVGAELARHCTRKYLPHGVSAEISDDRKIGFQYLRMGHLSVGEDTGVPIFAIPNPASARGFQKQVWREALKSFRA